MGPGLGACSNFIFLICSERLASHIIMEGPEWARERGRGDWGWGASDARESGGGCGTSFLKPGLERVPVGVLGCRGCWGKEREPAAEALETPP